MTAAALGAIVSAMVVVVGSPWSRRRHPRRRGRVPVSDFATPHRGGWTTAGVAGLSRPLLGRRRWTPALRSLRFAPALVALVRRLRHGVTARRGADDAAAKALPDLIDLLSLATSAGLALPAALVEVAPWAPSELRPGLTQACASIDAGTAAHVAVGRLVDQAPPGRVRPIGASAERGAPAWGDAARPLVHALGDHLVHGTPLSPSLHRIADDARDHRRRAAQARARRLPVLLLFPLVTCTLPAFALLTVAPIVASTLQSLDPTTLEASASDLHQPEVSPCNTPSCPPTFTSSP